VRRAAAALCALALGALVLAPAAGSARGDASASGGCTWKRHSKRVVKHVKRHGKRRRVVRVRHWWTCVRTPVAAPGAGGTPGSPGTGTQGPGETPASNRLGVKAKEFEYVLSRPSVTAGEVIVELNNQGEDPHNLNLRLANGQGPEFHIEETDSLKRSTEHFTLQPGTYRLWCSLPGHEELGMKATLAVG
jgi:plastocyanin